MHKAVPYIITAVLGLGIGSAVGGDTETITETRTVTKEVPGPEKIVEVEVPSPSSVPSECIDALDAAEDGFNVTSRFAGVTAETLTSVSDVFTALGEGDFDGTIGFLDEQDARNASVNGLSSELDGILANYTSAADVCRNAAE